MPDRPAAARPSLVAPLALAAAASCLGAGLYLPIMHVRWLLLLDRPVSILGGIRALAAGGDLATAGVLLAFSVVFPFAKILALFACWAALRRGRCPARWLLGLIGFAGRWSMLDVFVVAFLVFAIKARPLADADFAVAILPFVAAVVLTAVVGRAIGRAAELTRQK